MATPHKWRAAQLVDHRTGKEDPFTDKFFDPFGICRDINQNFNLRSEEFNRRYNRGEYDNLGWRQDDD